MPYKNPEDKKLYRERNKEKIKELNKQWRENKFKCPCGSCVSRQHKAEHLRTKKHLDYENNK